MLETPCPRQPYLESSLIPGGSKLCTQCRIVVLRNGSMRQYGCRATARRKKWSAADAPIMNGWASGVCAAFRGRGRGYCICNVPENRWCCLNLLPSTWYTKGPMDWSGKISPLEDCSLGFRYSGYDDFPPYFTGTMSPSGCQVWFL